jgi:hypothetical protein
MPKSTEELEKELREFLVDLNSKPEVKAKVKVVPEKVKAKVKVRVASEIILGEIENGLKPIEIAKKYHLSKSAISQRIKTLKDHELLIPKSKKPIIPEKVKVLALPMTKKNLPYEFQTIQILIPLKKPEQFDLIKWDKYIPEIKQSYKRFPYFKFTLNRTTKSIRLFLHKRFIEYPEQIQEICRAYIKWCSEVFLKYDIELDITKARSYGLHLWSKDKIIQSNYDKSFGVIGVKHGQESVKIFPGDIPTERKTWIESTPTPDGIESNDYSFFVDKSAMEYVMGKPDTKIPLDNPKIELPQYMRNVTKFANAMESVSSTFYGLDQRLETYDKNIRLHTEVQLKQLDNLERQSEHLDNQSIFFKEVKDMIKLQTDLIPQLVKELNIVKLEKNANVSMESDLECPFCKSTFSMKALEKKKFRCPDPICDRNLSLFFQR